MAALEVNIILDGRETRVAQELRNLKVSFTSKELHTGDIMFERGDDTVLICERKTYADLSSSITDGRFAQQREALKSSGVKVIYILEGPNAPRNDKDHVKTLGALENLALVHSIPVLPTTSVAQTAIAIQHLKKKLDDQPVRTGSDAIVPKIIQRKDKIMANVMSHQLQVITGVSPDVAKSIVAMFPTMRSLMSAYERLPADDESRKNMLASIPVNKRRVGPAVSQRVYQAMYGII